MFAILSALGIVSRLSEDHLLSMTTATAEPISWTTHYDDYHNWENTCCVVEGFGAFDLPG